MAAENQGLFRLYHAANPTKIRARTNFYVNKTLSPYRCFLTTGKPLSIEAAICKTDRIGLVSPFGDGTAHHKNARGTKEMLAKPETGYASFVG